MDTLLACLALGLIALTAWKHVVVVRFFRRPVPSMRREPALVSILQPILSGDPTLPACLEHNLRMRTRYPVEFIWLVDLDDEDGQVLCRQLIALHPERRVEMLLFAPAPQGQNPKTFKLVAGLDAAHGDIVCVLDDDTMLPDGGLEQCLPFLDEAGVGLAFGLPYQVNFSNLWSSLVAYFVNSSSLLTYIPYVSLNDPVTINGMFYAARRATWDAVGGFGGLEPILADDFAVAQRFRDHGYRLAQTPLRHAISTQVPSARRYLSLLQRWFVFPRESLLRHLGWREQMLVYVLAMTPALGPLLLSIGLMIWPSWLLAGLISVYLLYVYLIFAYFNLRYLNRASPWGASWLVVALQLVFPLQLIAALLMPQRIVWRGHLMQVERGGGFRFVRRRRGSRYHRGTDRW